jgi:hypothetical protein
LGESQPGVALTRALTAVRRLVATSALTVGQGCQKDG